jgi:hypothetical protein
MDASRHALARYREPCRRGQFFPAGSLPLPGALALTLVSAGALTLAAGLAGVLTAATGLGLDWAGIGLLPKPFQPIELHAASCESASTPASSTLCCSRFMFNSSVVGVFQVVCVTMQRATGVRGANGRDVPAEAGSA